MAILAKEGEKKDFEQVTPGTHQGVCYDIWDIGYQEGEYKGKKKVLHTVIVGFEVNEPISKGEFEGKRKTINRFYTLSLGEKANLRADLESWRGKAFTSEELKGFDIEKLIGVNCMLSITHNEKGRAKITGIGKMMAGLMPLKPENERSIPKWIEDFKAKSVGMPMYEDSENSQPVDAEDNPIPF